MTDESTTPTFDVAIVGGGMVGASLALALQRTSLRIVLIEGFAAGADSQPSFDDRTTAIGNGSRAVFEGLGVWSTLAAEAEPIRAIHVSDAGRFGFARLEAHEQDLEAFGHVIPNRAIGRALWAKLEAQPGVELRVPARCDAVVDEGTAMRLDVHTASGNEMLRSRLLVAADGAQSGLRQQLGLDHRVEDYGQVAVVVNVATDRPHDGTAFERFTPRGPLAVLPLRDGSYTVVWAMAPNAAERATTLDDPAFLRELQSAFGWRAGRFVRLGKRATYPLALTRSESTHAARAVLIGNAAQALHPVAGQGFNLGLRDAAALAEILSSQPADADVGAATLLEDFAAWRASDRRGVTQFTDGLVKLFADERPGFGLARDLGLLLFDVLPPAKRALSRVSWGFGGRLPRLARGLPLRGRA